MPLLVTSASGVNGDGYGALLAFDNCGAPLGVFCDDERIADPRGLVVHREEGLLYLNSGRDRVLALDAGATVVRDTGLIEGLNPGGGNFGPDRRYYVGLRSARTVAAFSPALDAPNELFLAPGIVPFPRVRFRSRWDIFSRLGDWPDGRGRQFHVALAPNNDMRPSRLVSDPELSPLDLAIAPNGNIVVSSEYPFGASDAVTTVREYDALDGHLVRVFRPEGMAEFRRPRGLRFSAEGNLYCVARDEVVVFDFMVGTCLGAVVRMPRLHGQAVVLFPQ